MTKSFPRCTFKTFLLLIFPVLIRAGKDEGRFYKFTSNRKMLGSVIRSTTDFPGRMGCAQLCIAHSKVSCLGFNWDQSGGNCEILNKIITSQFSSAPGVEIFVGHHVECVTSSECLGPFDPVCRDNICTLNCGPHQTQTPDRNCSLALSFQRSRGPFTSLEWVQIEGNTTLDQLEFGPGCEKADSRCGFLLGIQVPPSRYYDFWPLAYNYWPSQSLYITQVGGGELKWDHLVNDYGTKTTLIVKSGTSSGISDQPMRFKIIGNKESATRWSFSIVLHSSGRVIVDHEALEAPFGTTLDNEDYFLSMVHSGTSKLNIHGPTHLKLAVKMISTTNCSNPDAFFKYQFRSGKPETCVLRRNEIMDGSDFALGNYVLVKPLADVKINLRSTDFSVDEFFVRLADRSSIDHFEQLLTKDHYELRMYKNGPMNMIQMNRINPCPSGSDASCFSEALNIIRPTEVPDIEMFDGLNHNLKIRITDVMPTNTVSNCELTVDGFPQLSGAQMTWEIAFDDSPVLISGGDGQETDWERCYLVHGKGRKETMLYTRLKILSLEGPGIEFDLGKDAVPLVFQD